MTELITLVWWTLLACWTISLLVGLVILALAVWDHVAERRHGRSPLQVRGVALHQPAVGGERQHRAAHDDWSWPTP